MDIRNFFGGGGKPKKKKKLDGDSLINAPDVGSKNGTSRSKSSPKVTSNISPSNAVPNESNENGVASKKRSKIKPEAIDDIKSMTDSASDDKVKVQEDEKPRRRKRPKIIIESDDGSDESDDSFELLEVEKEATPQKKEAIRQKPKPNPKPKSTKPSKRATDETACSDPAPAPAPAPKKRTKPSPSPKAKKELPASPLKPAGSLSSYPDPSPGTFDGITFVFSGVMDNLTRDDGIDYVKNVGGRVTTAVSGKTNYLVTGNILEDGRDVCEGSKYKKATELSKKVVILDGEGELYMLAKMMDEKKGKTVDDLNNESNDVECENHTKEPELKTSLRNPYSNAVSSKASNPYAAIKITNPYAKSASSNSKVSNPYASSRGISNPYKKESVTSISNPYSKSPSVKNTSSLSSQSSQPSCSGGGRANIKDANALWADKYAPDSTRMILGNAEAVKKLRVWLSGWEREWNKTSSAGKKRSLTQKGGIKKAALLSGPPGIGKTTTAVLVAQEGGRQVLELNASDARSQKTLDSSLGGVIGSQVLSFDDPEANGRKVESKRRCIIMDEVDGMGQGDRGGIKGLIEMIKVSKVPIICICNDRQSQKIRSLEPYCLDLKYRRPVKSVIARRALEVGKAEGMSIEYNAAEAVAESCGNDIRQVLNCLQMWSNSKRLSTEKKAPMTYRDYKSRDSLINKDEMLRVSLFDAAKMIIQGRSGLAQADEKAERAHLFKRIDAFFTDYSFTGLLVHQNYLKVAVRPFQQAAAKGDMDAEYDALVSMYKGTESMSDFAVAEHGVRSGDLNWGLLPFCSALAVKSGYHVGGEAGGFLPGFPEFSSWLGKNSSRNKKNRLLQELGHHMNYRISADKEELRLGYLPVIRDRFSSLLMRKDNSPNAKEAIEFMDEYGLDRDDIMENLDEFNLDSKAKKFSDLDSKVKASFTKEYNKGVHKSQALVDEHGVSTRKRKKVSDEEGGDDDDSTSNNSDADDEEIKKLFQKKKRGAKKPTAKRNNRKKSKK
mmetsp:Transcript_21326/g.32410  ORF Transcript_21326/g.32410 Transcript_21326/m.32410 type:complete len:1006 (+) Transcript_21326:103-3120(+)